MNDPGVALLIADHAGSTAMYELLGNEIASQPIGECLAKTT